MGIVDGWGQGLNGFRWWQVKCLEQAQASWPRRRYSLGGVGVGRFLYPGRRAVAHEIYLRPSGSIPRFQHPGY